MAMHQMCRTGKAHFRSMQETQVPRLFVVMFVIFVMAPIRIVRRGEEA